MKKLVASIMVAAVIGTVASAQANIIQALGLSVGGGVFIGGDFGGGAKATASYGGLSGEMSEKLPYFGAGGFLFLDAKYVELSLGLFGGGGAAKTTTKFPGTSTTTEKMDMSIGSFNIGLLGKYPFPINSKLSVFPLLGFDFQIVFSAKVEGDDYKDLYGGETTDFSATWFKFGGGLDYAITDKVYFRGEALYGFKIPTKAEKDIKDILKAYGEYMLASYGISGIHPNAETLLGHGLTVKLAIGYKL
jgi:hypothetical protein